MKLPGLLLAAVVALAGSTASAKGLTVDDMLAMQRVGAPVVSPDGKRVAFAVRDTDLDANRGRYDLWIANVDGSSVRRLTSSPENDTDPAWSADGKWLYFVSARSGSAQVWRLDPTAGGEAEQVTKLPLDVNGFDLFPDGKRLVVAIDVWPTAKTLAESVKLDAADAKKQARSKVRAYDALLFRHWDQWEDGRYSHLFVWSPDKPDDARDVTPGQTTDSPTRPDGGMDEVDIAPDGRTLAYVRRVAGREDAWKTNTDVFALALDGNGNAIGTATDVTVASLGYEFGPTFSPDGKWLAFRSMKRPGFEADRQRIVVHELATRKQRVVTEAWDRSADELA
ncbi:MAG: S9 family peptidase, partial [Proteobacteria bacterium]|nr:S9 family peptidase [Pseudomonadota bacterium]